MTAPFEAPRSEPRDGEEARIVRFLEQRPDFLKRHPSLYLTLAPPARVHGEVVADHMAAMLDATRQQNALLRDDVRHRRAGLCFRHLVEEALLWLVRTADPIPSVGAELALLLGVDTAELCLAGPVPGGRTLPADTLSRLLQGQDVVFRDAPTELCLLHGDGAALVLSDVLVRVPLEGRAAGLLALGSRDAWLLAPGTETALALLGRGLAGALERR